MPGVPTNRMLLKVTTPEIALTLVSPAIRLVLSEPPAPELIATVTAEVTDVATLSNRSRICNTGWVVSCSPVAFPPTG